MSREDELLNFAKMFHSRASLIGTRQVKWALWKMGDEYELEAERLHAEKLLKMQRRPNKFSYGSLKAAS